MRPRGPLIPARDLLREASGVACVGRTSPSLMLKLKRMLVLMLMTIGCYEVGFVVVSLKWNRLGPPAL